jgi:hypothetical protein
MVGMRTMPSWCGVVIVAFSTLVATTTLGASIDEIKLQIEAIERRDGVHTLKLYPVLKELASSLQAQESYAASLEPLRRMQNLVHRRYGVYSTMQYESVELMIDALNHLGNHAAVGVRERFMYALAQRSYPDDSIEMDAARWRFAHWNRDVGQYGAAMRLYDTSLAYLDDDVSAPAEKRIALLRARALIKYITGQCCVLTDLAKAKQLVETNGSTLEYRTPVILEYSDALILENQVPKARAILTEHGLLTGATSPALLGLKSAAEVTRASESPVRLPANARIIKIPKDRQGTIFSSQDGKAPATLGHPVALCLSEIRAKLTPSSMGQISTYVIDIKLTVDALGNPSDIRLEGNAPVKLDRYLRRMLMLSRYRPAVAEDGAFIEGELAFQETFTEDTTPTDDRIGWIKVLATHVCNESLAGSNAR